MSIKNNINLLLVNLGLKAVEVKLEQQKLSDGVTIIDAEVFEAGQAVFAIAEAQMIALPVGTYTLEDGRVLVVEEEGVIASIGEPEVEEEVPAEAETEMNEAPETTPQAKKIIESIVKEMQFAKDKEIEELKAEITALKSQLPVVEEVENTEEEVVELAAEPLVYNPENATEVKRINIAPNKVASTHDNVMARLWGKK